MFNNFVQNLYRNWKIRGIQERDKNKNAESLEMPLWKSKAFYTICIAF